jgi:hypothetical protein
MPHDKDMMVNPEGKMIPNFSQIPAENVANSTVGPSGVQRVRRLMEQGLSSEYIERAFDEQLASQRKARQYDTPSIIRGIGIALNNLEHNLRAAAEAAMEPGSSWERRIGEKTGRSKS